MDKKKYQLILSREQLVLLANCLEDISRFAAGQPELSHTIAEVLRGKDDTCDIRCEAEKYLRYVRNILLPKLHDNSNLGYNGTTFIGNTYQIYRTILYALAKDEGWNNTYSSPALPSGDMGTVKVEIIKE